MAAECKGRARMQTMALMLKAAKVMLCAAFGLSTYIEQSPWELLESSTSFVFSSAELGAGGRRLRGSADSEQDVESDIKSLQHELGRVAGALEATQDELDHISWARDKVEDAKKEDLEHLQKELRKLPKALDGIQEAKSDAISAAKDLEEHIDGIRKSTKEAKSDANSADQDLEEHAGNRSTSSDEPAQDILEIIAPSLSEKLVKMMGQRKYDFGLKFAGVTGLVFSVGLLVELCKKCCDNRSYRPVNDADVFGCCFVPVTLLYLVVFLAAVVIIPIHGQPQASCSAGLLWEDHFMMFLVIMTGKGIEILFYAATPREGIGIMKFGFKFFASLLAVADVYTDVCFTVIAYTCGSKFWISALVIFIVGVVFAQFVVPLAFLALFTCSEEMPLSEMSLSRITLLFHCGLAKVAGFDILFEFAPCNEKDKTGFDNIMGPCLALCAAGLRCCFEDFFQTVNQVLFVMASGRNPQVLISIAIGFLSSVLNLTMALWKSSAAEEK